MKAKTFSELTVKEQMLKRIKTVLIQNGQDAWLYKIEMDAKLLLQSPVESYKTIMMFPVIHGPWNDYKGQLHQQDTFIIYGVKVILPSKKWVPERLKFLDSKIQIVINNQIITTLDVRSFLFKQLYEPVAPYIIFLGTRNNIVSMILKESLIQPMPIPPVTQFVKIEFTGALIQNSTVIL